MNNAVLFFLCRTAVILVAIGFLSPVFVWANSGDAALPENLARKAKITASAEEKRQLAKYVADGLIPAQGGKWDWWQAWSIKAPGKGRKKPQTADPGAAARLADLTFEWNEPVSVAEVVYYGRTSDSLKGCFKNFELLLDDGAEPVARGQFEKRHGPQRIVLDQPSDARKLVLRFLDSHGGKSPGAAEVEIYSTSPPDFLLNRRGLVKESPELAARLKAGELGFDQLLLIQRHQINPSHVYTYHAEGFRPGGALQILTLNEDEPALQTLVPSPDGEILDCDLSYDGKEVVFSWRRTKDELYQVYRIGVDGDGLTRLTDGKSHNMNACWLPDGDIAFLSDRKPAYAYCMVTTVPTLYRMDRNGENIVRISANYLNDFTPSVLNDGRILYSRWEYVDRPAIPIQSLWTLNPDGTGLAGYFGNRILSPATFMEARAIPGSTKVICVMTAHNGPCRGAIGVIDRNLGVNAPEAIRNLTPEVDIGTVDQGNGNMVYGPYESPYPVDENYFLVSHQGAILFRDYDGTEQATVIERRDGLGFYSAQALRPRSQPPVLPSVLPDAAENWGTVYVQDVYNGLEPTIRRGEVKQIAVVQEIEKPKSITAQKRSFGFQFPVVSCGATYAPKKVWGYVDVEEDGSASFKVPAGLPIYFMALDADGRAVQRMRSFTHLMPGESQGCIGCHESRSQASPRLSAPSALDSPPQELRPPEWGVRGFSYSSIVQPVLDQHCTECHNAYNSPNGVDLSGDKTDYFNVSYEILARKGTASENSKASGVPLKQMGANPYTSWIPTYNGQEANILRIAPKEWGSHASKLAEIVLKGHPDHDGAPRIDLNDAEKRRIFSWIDLNVPYYGTSAAYNHNRMGYREVRPKDLDSVIREVAMRRCVSCHTTPDPKAKSPIPRDFYIRITKPEWNSFLLAPLAKAAGGAGICGESVFESKDDPDYRKILRTFDSIPEELKQSPRMDMMEEAQVCVQ